jgi:hypothetical protein
LNNTATIRALGAIVVVAVVLIFTEGSLTAATSSLTPQPPQNLICTHPANNGTCSQGGIMSATTQIPLPTTQQPQSQAPAALAIIKHVIDDIVGTISVKDFTSSASGTNVSPQSSFPGATTTVKSKPGTSSAVLLQQANATTITAADHNKCSSSSGGDIITCIHNETHYPAKDTTTPFVLPIPFP